MKTVNFQELGAVWIWNGRTDSVNQYVRFVHEFDMTALAGSKLLISADSDYVAYINGQLVGYGQYDDYPFYKVFDEYEIGHLLQKGKNRLCILGYHQGVDSFQYYNAEAGMIFVVAADNGVAAASGSDTLCGLCPAYVGGEMENISSQLSFTFKYDASKEDGWLRDNYSSIGWEHSTIVKKDLQLYPRPVKKLITGERVASRLCAQGVLLRRQGNEEVGLVMLRDFLSARRVFEISDWQKGEVILPDDTPFMFKVSAVEGNGAYLVLDLGREEVGLLDIEVDTAEGTVFEIGYGEHLDDLRVRSHVGERNFACRYVSKEGRQRFTHFIKRAGCRYIQMHITRISKDVKVHYAGILPVHYPVHHQNVELGDQLHKKIYEVAVRTLQLCMHEHYEDCPWREQALYAMDSRNQALCGYYCFDEYDFPQSCIRLFALNLQPDGLLELCAPARASITIPSFTFLWVLELYEFWKHSGRTEFVKEMFEQVKNICTKALERINGGLLPCYQETRYWNFYDWAEGLEGGRIFRDDPVALRFDAPLNMFFIIALEAAAQMAQAIGENALADAWIHHAHMVKMKTREIFYEDGSGLYYTYKDEEKRWHRAELTQALAVCSGCAGGEEAAALRQVLVNADNGLVPATLSYMAFKYDALLGDAGRYGQWVFENIASIWGSMLFQGATSFWEVIQGAHDFEQAGSLCHGWSAMPVYYYHRYGHLLR